MKLKVHERVIMSVLKEEKGRFKHSIRSVARGTLMSWSTAKKYLHTLKEKGLVKVNERGLWEINEETKIYNQD